MCASVGELDAQINKSSKLEAIDISVLPNFYTRDVSLEVILRVFFLCHRYYLWIQFGNLSVS